MRIGRFWVLLLALTGCISATTEADYPDDLYSPNYVLRTQAALEFAGLRDESQLPDAFDLLLDSEGQIRALAWTTIRSLARPSAVVKVSSTASKSAARMTEGGIVRSSRIPRGFSHRSSSSKEQSQ